MYFNGLSSKDNLSSCLNCPRTAEVKALELDPKNDLVIENLLSVYSFLEMTDKHKALKAKRG